MRKTKDLLSVAAFWAAAALLLIAFGLLCTGCSPRIIEQEVVKHDTTYIEKMSRDSIYMHDSVYIHEYTKGDTVYMERDRWHYGYKDKLVHDSIYISQRDTIVNVESITVPAAISGWQWFQIYAGRIALVLVLIGIVILIVKHKY
jgi:hypothetical protein